MPKETRVNGGTKAVAVARAKSSPGSPARKPKLGQHFLIDRDAAKTVVEALGDISARR